MTIAVTALLSVNPAVGDTTTDGSEQTLASGTAAGIFELNLNRANMVDGDFVELRAYKKVNDTTKQQVAFATIARGGDTHVQFGPIATATYIEFTLKRVAGTDRAYKWSIENYEGA